MTPLEEFDFSVLDSPDFKEDAVREEIIAPILRTLGYTPSGTTRVQRSKSLAHPYVMIGSKKHPVQITPDYTLWADDTSILILDAKAPWEPIVASHHVEQAYSYAIHPEVRCEHYALCNGRELALYNIRESAPIGHITLNALPATWEEVKLLLAPQYLKTPELRNFAPDYGLHARRAGIGKDLDIIFVSYYLQEIAMVEDGLYTTMATHDDNGTEYLASFDLGRDQLNQLLATLPDDISRKIRASLSRQPFRFDLGGKVVANITGRLGDVTRGPFEEFVPIIASEVESAYDPDITLTPYRRR
ncbi:hypothetical protein WME89_43185 [Sorangium sp. So ce321]|uniref:hypothetical protein n=1 Tax=Sorangium sp. So ce321 TaxID=3133300 RepID=UPI003F5E554F